MWRAVLPPENPLCNGMGPQEDTGSSMWKPVDDMEHVGGVGKDIVTYLTIC
jgi:hypothetical protein